jgi:hypothetical protein
VIETAAGIALILATLAASRLSVSVDLVRFPLCWIGVLLALDGLARRRGFRLSLREWVTLAFASVAFWDLFELVDLRLRNWWYVGVSPNPMLSSLFAMVSFATVLPAARLGLAIVGDRGAAGPKRLSPLLLLALGLAMLGAALLFPRVAFPLAWIFLWPICEAGCALKTPASLRSPLEGNWLAPLICALPLGLLWESLNWGCARGWVYTVPGFEAPKLFEMPLAGYLGYLPFLLEAGAALALLDRWKPRPVWVVPVLLLHFGGDVLARGATDFTFAGEVAPQRWLETGIPLRYENWPQIAQATGDDPALVRLWLRKLSR